MDNNKLILVNGTFDVLHPGHLKLLRFAKSLGSFLLVAADSDERIKKLKGDTRPVFNLDERISVLEELRCVDKVIWFGCDEGLRNIYKQYKPYAMVKGSDYEGKYSIGQEFCKEVIYVPKTGHSTTKTIESISSW